MRAFSVLFFLAFGIGLASAQPTQFKNHRAKRVLSHLKIGFCFLGHFFKSRPDIIVALTLPPLLSVTSLTFEKNLVHRPKGIKKLFNFKKKLKNSLPISDKVLIRNLLLSFLCPYTLYLYRLHTNKETTKSQGIKKHLKTIVFHVLPSFLYGATSVLLTITFLFSEDIIERLKEEFLISLSKRLAW